MNAIEEISLFLLAEQVAADKLQSVRNPIGYLYTLVSSTETGELYLRVNQWEVRTVLCKEPLDYLYAYQLNKDCWVVTTRRPMRSQDHFHSRFLLVELWLQLNILYWADKYKGGYRQHYSCQPTSAATQARPMSCNQSQTSILASDWLQLKVDKHKGGLRKQINRQAIASVVEFAVACQVIR